MLKDSHAVEGYASRTPAQDEIDDLIAALHTAQLRLGKLSTYVRVHYEAPDMRKPPRSIEDRAA